MKLSTYIAFGIALIAVIFVFSQNNEEIASNSDQIHIAYDSMPRTFDTRYAVDANSQYITDDLAACSLITYNKQGNLTPSLAKSWRWLNPTTLEIELAKDFHFSDGNLVTAKDIEATYQFFLNQQKDPSPRQGAFKGIQKISTTSSTITFDLQEPDASFITNLVIGILPTATALGPMLTSKDSIPSCGPFVFAKKDLNSFLLVRNPHHSSTSKSNQKQQLHFELIKDQSTCYAKLRNGELDLAQNIIDRDNLKSLANTKHLNIHSESALKTNYLGFNLQDPLLKQKKLRKAIAMALDQQKLLDGVLHGYGELSVSMLPPGHQFHFKAKPLTHDLKAAKKLIDEIKEQENLDPSQPLIFSYKTTANKARITLAHGIAQQLAPIGIKLNIESLEWGRFKDDVDRGRIQLWSLAWIGYKDPSILNYAFASEYMPPNGGNRGRYNNSELDTLLSRSLHSTDTSQRIDLYTQAQKIIAEELPYIFLFHEQNIVVTHQRLKNFSVFADGRYSSLKSAFTQM